MHIFQEGQSGDETCVYLPEEQSRVSYRIIEDCSGKAYADRRDLKAGDSIAPLDFPDLSVAVDDLMLG